MASPLVTTDVIMVNLFPYLAIRYQADDIPTTVVNGAKTLVGPYDEADAMARILVPTAAPPHSG
jgi:hypothetical protein